MLIKAGRTNRCLLRKDLPRFRDRLTRRWGWKDPGGRKKHGCWCVNWDRDREGSRRGLDEGIVCVEMLASYRCWVMEVRERGASEGKARLTLFFDLGSKYIVIYALRGVCREKSLLRGRLRCPRGEHAT